MVGRPGPARISWDLLRAQREGAAGVAGRRDRRLARLVRHARTGSPYYRRHYRGLPDDVPLAALPPAVKQELMAEWDDWVTDPAITLDAVRAYAADPTRTGVPYRNGAFVCSGSGTTGVPGVFIHDAHAANVYLATITVRGYLAWFPPAMWPELARRGVRMATVLGTGRHFAGVAWIERARHDSRFAARALRVVPAQQPLDRIVSGLHDYQPTVLGGYPSALALLTQEKSEGRLDLHPLLVAASGESWPRAAQERTAQVFGCRVRESYAASECLFVAFSCGDGWLHHSSDWTILEPVEADLTPTPAGQQSHTVLLTNLANRLQPFLRYDLGDSVLVRPDPCPCGNPLPAIRIAGRSADVLRLVDHGGRKASILPLPLGAAAEAVPGVRRVQLIQSAPGALRIRFAAEPGADQALVGTALVAQVAAHLRTQGLTAIELSVDDDPPGADPRSGKFRQVVPLAGLAPAGPSGDLGGPLSEGGGGEAAR